MVPAGSQVTETVYTVGNTTTTVFDTVQIYDYESANWMLLIGAYNAMNMDGGGSTTLVKASSVGAPVLLNESSAAADEGRRPAINSAMVKVSKWSINTCARFIWPQRQRR